MSFDPETLANRSNPLAIILENHGAGSRKMICNSINASWSFLKRGVVAIKLFICMCASKGHQQADFGMRFLVATEGGSFERSFSAFRTTPAGPELLQQRPDIKSIFGNRALLEVCPPGSLGRWYVAFMKDHDLDEDYYLGTAHEIGPEFEGDAERAWFRTRVDSSHDIRHVLSGYGPDDLGEICLLSFRFGQTRHFGILTLAVLWYLNLAVTRRGSVFAPMVEAYRRGRRAQSLDLLPWENGFAQGLSTHRANLGLTPPRRYLTAFAPDAYPSRERPKRPHEYSHVGVLGGGV
jgi:ubiquinone biosynthesis protein COQ4